jgi:hypothetical protein
MFVIITTICKVFSNFQFFNKLGILSSFLFIGLLANSQTKFISKEKAIELAQKNKCYSTTKSTLMLDSLKKVWIVARLDTTYYTKEGNCKNTNGCTVQMSTILKLNAISGKVISKKKKKEVFANYE